MEPPARPDPTRRFSSRVENYLLYRPHYPKDILALLETKCGLTPASVIADIGSGTGFLAELFLEHGNRVYGVEPNREMREAGERLLQGHSGFTSIAAPAEATTLAGQSVDFITAGQAFHWFDRARCREEFRRILRPGGWIVLVWNDRRTDSTPFLAGYEELLHTYATDYAAVNHKQIDAAVLHEFFGAEPAKASFPNFQHFDLAALKGRLLSSSYAPETGQPGHEPMIAALELLFKKHQREGRVTFEYESVVYYGCLS